MAFDYTEFVVLLTFHNGRKSDYDPTVEELDQWDTDLGRLYESKIPDLFNEFSIALTQDNKSRAVALAEVSNGQQAGTRLRNACKFLAAAQDLPLSGP